MPSQLPVDTPTNDQVHLIETRLDELAAERFNLLRQLNDLRAGTCGIPPEILSEIFTMSPTPLRLGAVCSLWREVAWNTPELWTTIKCDPNRSPQGGVTDDSLYLLRLFFKNSGQLKVVVELIDIDRWHTADDQLETIREILAIVTTENQDKIRALTLKASHPWDARIWKMVHPFFQTQHFPHLEKVHLLGCSTAPLVLQNAPRLRQFFHSNAVDALLSRNQPYWSQITTVRLEMMPLVYCLWLLRLPPPQLEVFECVNPISCGQFLAPINIMTEITTLPHLVNFEWTGKLGFFRELLWKGFRLPATRTLTWNHPRTLTKTCTDLQRTFFQSLPMLETLKIQQYHSIKELRSLWECLDSLRELELDACKLEKNGVNIMRVLTLLDNPDHRNLLPNLKKLRIDVLIGRGISRMLCSRRDGPLSTGVTQRTMGSRLEQAVIYMEDVVCAPGEWEVLRALVSGGLQLDMIIGDEPVRWL